MPPVSYTRIPQTPGGNGFASFFQHRWRPNIALENFGDRCRWYDRTMVQWFSISGIMRYWASEVSGLIMINYGPIIIPTDELMTNSYFSEGLGWNHQSDIIPWNIIGYDVHICTQFWGFEMNLRRLKLTARNWIATTKNKEQRLDPQKWENVSWYYTIMDIIPSWLFLGCYPS